MLNKATKEKDFEYVYRWSDEHKQYILIKRKRKQKTEEKNEKENKN